MQSEKSDYINKNLLPDTYSFENFLEYNGLYVDKTEYLYKLVSSGKRLFFFSRPRRFGKSLTISTLKAIFQGRKELFKGLYIENQPYDWKKNRNLKNNFYAIIVKNLNGFCFRKFLNDKN